MHYALFPPGKPTTRRISTIAALTLIASTLPTFAGTALATPVAAPLKEPGGTTACVEQQPDEASAMAVARACGKAVENLAGRSETAEVFANPDGTWTAKMYAGPVRM